jgi:Arc/MetJ-type ribon-helix-helix transcriptional regulator
MGNKRKFTTVSIPTPLFQKVKKHIEGTGFPSVSSYVTFILREIISSPKSRTKSRSAAHRDEEIVRRRLRSLGYIE